MGCLTVHVHRMGDGLKISSARIGDGLQASARRIGCGLKVTCGLFCPINKERILKVEPTHIFLMKTNNYTEQVCVISNVKWHVS